jgi:hypothetical protein
MTRKAGILTSCPTEAIQTEPHIPPVAGNGALFIPCIQDDTYFFIFLVLYRVLFEGLISDTLQVIHKGLWLD